MKQKFIEWFTKNNNGCSPAMEDDRGFVHEKTRHMFEAYQAGMAEGEARCAALTAENAGMKEWSPNPHSASMFEAIEKAEELMDDGMPELAMIEAFEILKMKRTPETDAFLAEVRAQAKADGVQEYADSFRHSASKIRECYGDNIRVRALLHEASNADNFAAQLRKGVQP